MDANQITGWDNLYPIMLYVQVVPDPGLRTYTICIRAGAMLHKAMPGLEFLPAMPSGWLKSNRMAGGRDIK